MDLKVTASTDINLSQAQFLPNSPAFNPPSGLNRRELMSSAARFCRENLSLNRRNELLNTEGAISYRHDGQPVFLYRFLGPEELTQLLQKGYYRGIDCPPSENNWSYLDQVVKTVCLVRGVEIDTFRKSSEFIVDSLSKAGVASAAELVSAATLKQTDRLGRLVRDEFSPAELACAQKLPILSGISGLFSTSLVPSDILYLVDGMTCYVELAVPARRMQPSHLEAYLDPTKNFRDCELEVCLDHYYLSEVSRLYFNLDDMVNDGELFTRLGVTPQDDIYYHGCPFRKSRSTLNFLGYLPKEILAEPERWINRQFLD